MPDEPSDRAGSRMSRVEVLLKHSLQHHDDRSLRHLVLKGRDTERPTRAIRFRNVRPAHWRRLVATRLDAVQEVQEIGFQVSRIGVRHHAVDAGCSILAGEPVGLLHPFQIDEVVQRGQRHTSLRSCQFSYPLSFRGQVCEAQGPLPCFPPTVLSTWHPSFLDRVQVSPVPRCHRSYWVLRLPATHPRSLICFASEVHALLLASCLAICAPSRSEGPSRPGSLFDRLPELPVRSHADVNGISQVSRRSILCLCPALRPRPNRRPLAS